MNYYNVLCLALVGLLSALILMPKTLLLMEADFKFFMLISTELEETTMQVNTNQHKLQIHSSKCGGSVRNFVNIRSNSY